MVERNWIAAVIAFALASCGAGEEAAAPRTQAPAGQRLKVAAAEIAEIKSVAAEVATRDQAEALVRIPGRLVRLTVREGDVVKRGQQIGLVVDERIGFETRAFEAQIAAAAAEAERARAELSRVVYLHKRGFYATARLEQAQAAARSANAQLEAARAVRSASASSAGQGAILAPASGQVLRADIPEGSVVAAGMSVATVTAGPPLLRLHIPQSLAGQVRIGTAVTVEDPGLGTRTGRLVQVYPAVSGGQIMADAVLPGLTADLVGRRVSVRLAVGSRTGILVPRRFVVTQYGIDYVDIVSRDGISRIPVQVAATGEPAQVEILSGVEPGDILRSPGPAR